MNLTDRPIYQKGQRPVRSRAARTAARDQRCTLRLSCCKGDTATTVLAHVRAFGGGGMSSKPADYKAVFACAACHDALDRRVEDAEWGWDDITRAVFETLDRQFAAGVFIAKEDA